MTEFLNKCKTIFYITATLNIVTLIAYLIKSINDGQAKSLYLAINFCFLIYVLCKIKVKENKKVQEVSLKLDNKLFNFMHTIVIFIIKLTITILKSIVFIFICIVFPHSHILLLLIKIPVLFLAFGWIILTWSNDELGEYYIK
jgi:hypothetical protein